MKAAVYHKYGPPEVLRVEDIPTPVPKPDEVLIRVRAATVSSADWRARSLNMPRGFGAFGRPAFGFFGPRQKVLGTGFAGEIAEVGAKVTGFRQGDRVFGDCGMKMGAHAEFVVLKADAALASMPDDLGFEDAAALVFGGTVALIFLRDKGKVQANERVLVNGASGEVGVAMVQIARHFGAEVFGVSSAANAGLLRGLGATPIDYNREDFTDHGPFDVIVDTVGNAGWARSHKALREGGRLLLVLAGLGEMILAPLRSRQQGKRAIAGVAMGSAADLELLAKLAASGAIKPVIGKVFALADVVEAHRLVDSGHKVGAVVLHIG